MISLEIIHLQINSNLPGANALIGVHVSFPAIDPQPSGQDYVAV